MSQLIPRSTFDILYSTFSRSHQDRQLSKQVVGGDRAAEPDGGRWWAVATASMRGTAPGSDNNSVQGPIRTLGDAAVQPAPDTAATRAGLSDLRGGAVRERDVQQRSADEQRRSRGAADGRLPLLHLSRRRPHTGR